MHAIGIDIGGTATRVGIVAENSTLLAIERFATGDEFGALCSSLGHVLSSIVERSSASSQPCLPVGLAIPGLTDEKSGLVSRCVNLPFLEGRDPVELLPAALRDDAQVMSDADAATWGEFSACGRSATRFAHLRLGTGVGCGLIVDGVPVDLPRPEKQHADVLVVDKSSGAVLCRCGRRGCLETIASRASLCERSREGGFGSDLTGLAEVVSRGDRGAIEVVDGVARGIGVVAANLATEYAVDVVSLGGGVVAALPSLVESVRRCVADFGAIRIAACTLGDDAGVVGAGLWALRGS